MIIAIDGPAGAGKGTLGRRLAQHYGFAFLETGLLYRAVAYAVKINHVDPTKEDQVVNLVSHISFEDMNPDVLRNNEIAEITSQIAQFQGLRAQLLAAQRDFATLKSKTHGGAILDGRDVGTYVLKDAHLKFYVTASLEERAKRRFKELQVLGEQKSLEVVQEEVRIRDERDMTRAECPLKPAEDAIVVDTSSLTVDQGVNILKHFIDSLLPN